ncbi:MAG TPA: FmdB family zinc ribbon protein [Gaiellales bacterium]|jgi:putative FmdB family regulatory protein
MPTYDYLCENGHRFEYTQRITEDALETCIECGAPVRRMLHAPAIHFKGSGFYSTDYGSRKRGPNGAGQESKAESASSSDSKSESTSDSSSSTSSSSDSTKSTSGGGDKSPPATKTASSD